MSRQVYLLGVGLVPVAGAFLLTNALVWHPGVTAANVARIRSGMTPAEVEALLGGPPDCSEREDDSGERACYWTDECGFAVDRFASDRVAETRFSPRSRRPGSPARPRAWLGW